MRKDDPNTKYVIRRYEVLSLAVDEYRLLEKAKVKGQYSKGYRVGRLALYANILGYDTVQELVDAELKL